MVRKSYERPKVGTPEHTEFCRRVTVGTRAGVAAMSLEKRKLMGQHISESLNNRSKEAKEATGKMISEGLRAYKTSVNLSVPLPDVSEVFAQWFTGFWEGDGDVCCMERLNHAGTGFVFRPEIEFAQKDSDVVEYVAQELKGVLGWTKRNQDLYRMVRWDGQVKCVPVIKLLSLHVISVRRCEQLSTACVGLGLPICFTHSPTLQWISGFWDAEGSIELSVTHEPIITFYQKETELLDVLQRFLGTGVVRPHGSVSCLSVTANSAQTLAGFLASNTRIERKKNMLIERCGLNG